jgi:putative FmdB family regulatory protein
MAAYDYRCRTCDSVFEVHRPVTADAGAVRCPDGHDEVSRVWSAVAIGTGARGGEGASAAPLPAGGGCCGGGCGCGR